MLHVWFRVNTNTCSEFPYAMTIIKKEIQRYPAREHGTFRVFVT